MKEIKPEQILCNNCGSLKSRVTEFCDKCQKKTVNLHKIELKDTMYVSDSVNFLKKWGDVNFGYLITFFSILVAFLFAVIPLIPLNWYNKILFFVFSFLFLIEVCFLNEKSKLKIIKLIEYLKTSKI